MHSSSVQNAILDRLVGYGTSRVDRPIAAVRLLEFPLHFVWTRDADPHSVFIP